MIVLQVGVLVTLGGCCLLAGLVIVSSVEARKEIVRGSGESFVRGCVLTPREIAKSNWSKARGVGLRVVRPGQELELR